MLSPYAVPDNFDNPRIPEEQLPAVMREQLADFGGTMGKVREQVTDPNRLVYRPFGS
jgi:hypothetical protein